MKSRNRLWSLVAALAFCFVLQPIAATESDTFQNGLVKTKYGILKGYSTEKGTLAWKGVPYAKPPVEDIRWKPPQDPDPWLGVRDAKESCEPCAQRYISRYWVGKDRYFGQEDCLYLDIYGRQTPQDIYRFTCGFTGDRTRAGPQAGRRSRTRR